MNDLCRAPYDAPPTHADPQPTSMTYGCPIFCTLPINHDDPMHRSGELSWPTAEYAHGRASVEAVGTES